MIYGDKIMSPHLQGLKNHVKPLLRMIYFIFIYFTNLY
jgi:hypothetical protein